MNYAYIRVSTTSQDIKRQEIALENFKIDKKYIDKLSGKNTDRPELNKMIIEAKEGDNIHCESISRLGRNVDDLRKLVADFVAKGVIVHFIKEGLSTNGDTYKFLLTILGAVAEMEREQIVDRVKQGVEKAKIYGTKSGKAIGRPALETPKEFSKYYKQWKKKIITAVEFRKLLQMSKTSLYRHIEKYEVDNNVR